MNWVKTARRVAEGDARLDSGARNFRRQTVSGGNSLDGRDAAYKIIESVEKGAENGRFKAIPGDYPL